MVPSEAPVHGASDLLESFSRQGIEYPIQMFTGGPPTFSLGAQRNVMKWTHDRGYFLPDPNWLDGPDINGIEETVWPVLEYLGCSRDGISIKFLAAGRFNRVYTIQATATAVDTDTDRARNYVFRVALPVDPYHKVESEVATTELVRHFTTIPVPIIYAYDSSARNAIGLEWILMEKVTSGKKLEDIWQVIDDDTKCHLSQSAANWMAQLSVFTSNKIGSIYMRFTEDTLDFYVGRCVNNLLTQENRLLYDVPRGPFESLEGYYEALISVTELDVTETIHAFRSGDLQFDGSFLDQGVLQSDGSDRLKELDMFSSGLERLREALPELCAKTQDPHPFVTMLAHLDLSQSNILVDDIGTPVAVLDWENIQLSPLLFLTRTPDFMDSPEEDHAPEVSDLNEQPRNLNNHTCTLLRQLYRDTLRHLDSPLSDAVWHEMPKFDRDLLTHIRSFSARAEDNKVWVVSRVPIDPNEPIQNGMHREVLGEDSSSEGHGSTDSPATVGLPAEEPMENGVYRGIEVNGAGHGRGDSPLPMEH